MLYTDILANDFERKIIRGPNYKETTNRICGIYLIVFIILSFFCLVNISPPNDYLYRANIKYDKISASGNSYIAFFYRPSNAVKMSKESLKESNFLQNYKSYRTLTADSFIFVVDPNTYQREDLDKPLKNRIVYSCNFASSDFTTNREIENKPIDCVYKEIKYFQEVKLVKYRLVLWEKGFRAKMGTIDYKQYGAGLSRGVSPQKINIHMPDLEIEINNIMRAKVPKSSYSIPFYIAIIVSFLPLIFFRIYILGLKTEEDFIFYASCVPLWPPFMISSAFLFFTLHFDQLAFLVFSLIIILNFFPLPFGKGKFNLNFAILLLFFLIMFPTYFFYNEEKNWESINDLFYHAIYPAIYFGIIPIFVFNAEEKLIEVLNILGLFTYLFVLHLIFSNYFELGIREGASSKLWEIIFKAMIIFFLTYVLKFILSTIWKKVRRRGSGKINRSIRYLSGSSISRRKRSSN